MKGVSRTRTRETWSEAELFAERRSRTTTVSNPNPAWGSFSTQVDEYPEYSPRQARCTDVSGNRGGDNPLQITYEGVKLPKLVFDLTVKHYSLPQLTGLERNWRIDYEIPVEANVANSGTIGEADIAFVTRAANATNPSAARVDVAQFVGELRDAPKLLKFAGDRLTKFGANEYLKYQYGWKPFVKDVRKLVQGVDRMDKIFNRLRTLRKGDVLRSMFDPRAEEAERIDESYFAEVNVPDPWGFGAEITMNKSYYGSIRRWCICRYKADRPEGMPQSDPELLALARKAAYGLTIDGKTAWELMPWSWLIDWTTNHSEFIGSQRNVVGASLSGTVLMRTTQTHVQYTPDVTTDEATVTINSKTGFPGNGFYLAKERFIDVMPAAINTGEINLLKTDFFKQSILGALALQRLKGLPF